MLSVCANARKVTMITRRVTLSKYAVLAFTVIAALRTVNAEDTSVDTAQLMVAKCKAQCLDKFIPVNSPVDDKICKETSDCFMCWDTCYLLNENFAVWGGVCDNKQLCFAGCQQSCGFYSQETLSVEEAISESSFQLKFMKPIQFVNRPESVSLSWIKPSGENDSEKVVYSVFQRNHITKKVGAKWKFLMQTSELSAEVNKSSLSPSSTLVDFKVMAVTGSGRIGQLISSYLVANTEPELNDQEMPEHLMSTTTLPLSSAISKNDGANIGSSTENRKEDESSIQGQDIQIIPRWKLYLMTLQHNPKLGSVDAVVTWAAPGLTGNFLVTWEVKEGTFAITGHLYTDSTTVTLSLWPATTYSIQVELVSSALDKAIRSEPLIVNTDSIDTPNHYSKTDDDISVVIAPSKECNETLAIASVAVAASFTVVIVGLFILIRRWRRKNVSKDSPNILNNKIRRTGAICRKIILSPLPIDVEGTCQSPSTTITLSPLPSCLPLNEKLTTFQGFVNENMGDYLNDENDIVSSSFPHQTTNTKGVLLPSINRFQFGDYSVDEVMSTNEDCQLTDDGNVFENQLQTQKLLEKPNNVRIQFTAI
ncbi:hypothetical protein CHUAL_006542 [Chamberlinius hualienensis]